MMKNLFVFVEGKEDIAFVKNVVYTYSFSIPSISYQYLIKKQEIIR